MTVYTLTGSFGTGISIHSSQFQGYALSAIPPLEGCTFSLQSPLSQDVSAIGDMRLVGIEEDPPGSGNYFYHMEAGQGWGPVTGLAKPGFIQVGFPNPLRVGVSGWGYQAYLDVMIFPISPPRATGTFRIQYMRGFGALSPVLAEATVPMPAGGEVMGPVSIHLAVSDTEVAAVLSGSASASLSIGPPSLFITHLAGFYCAPSNWQVQQVTSLTVEGNADFCPPATCDCVQIYRFTYSSNPGNPTTGGSFRWGITPFYQGIVHNTGVIAFDANTAAIQFAFNQAIGGPLQGFVVTGAVNDFTVRILVGDGHPLLFEASNSLIGSPVPDLIVEEVEHECCEPLPDLIPEIISVIPDHAFPGETVQLTYKICNWGQGEPHAAWNDAIFLNRNCAAGEIGGFIQLHRGGPLAPDGCYTKTVSVTIPLSYAEEEPTSTGAAIRPLYGDRPYYLTIKVWSSGLSYISGPIYDADIENLAALQAAVDASGLVGLVVTLLSGERYAVAYTEPVLVTSSEGVDTGSDEAWNFEVYTDVGSNVPPPLVYPGEPPREVYESAENNNHTCAPFGLLVIPPRPDLTPTDLVQLIDEVHLYTVVPPPFGATTGGSYGLQSVGTIQWNDSQEVIQALYDAFYGVGQVVIGGNAAQFAATYSGPLVYGTQVNPLLILTNALTGSTGVPTILSEEAVIGGPTETASAYPGETIRIRWVVINQGDADVLHDWMDRLRISVDEFYNLSSPELASEAKIAPLGIGIDYTVEKDVLIPTNTLAGNYWLVLKTDADLEVLESNESNNVRAITIAIGASIIETETPMVMMVSGF